MDRVSMKARWIAIAALALMSSGAQAQDEVSVWDGVYSAEQAERGKNLYLAQCSRCHGETLLGGEDGTPLVGEYFMGGWEGASAADLVERIRKTMPSDGPGVLRRAQSTDVSAYIFLENRFPAGDAAMASKLSALSAIRIEPKP